MSYRETVSVADLIPGDLIIDGFGYPVVGYPYRMGKYTVVPMGRISTRTGFLTLDWAYSDSETQVEVVRD
jgi:hypothetical protein